MSTRREGIGSPDSNIYPRPLRPSGLRTRERTPQNRPHADRPKLPPASAASSSLAPNSASPTTPTIVPLFESPVAADRANRRRGWVGGSSSRRLKFPKLREKTSVSKEDKKMATSPGLHPQGKSPRQFIIQSQSPVAGVEARFPAQGHNPTYRSSPSPTDKPLPSLPVATVKFKSPVRRSLIDCQERPLRRSVSPPDGGPAQEEEWPSMQPLNTGGVMPVFTHPQSSIKPSLGESFIEGMRGLHLDDKEKENMAPDTTGHYDLSEPVGHGKTMPTFRGHETGFPSITSSSRPLSSSQLPKPRESMLNSLARHNDGPAVRQTKTSTLRLRRSIGKRTWNSEEKKRDDQSQLSSVHERAQSPTVAKTRQITPAGPIRTSSRGRLGVTTRGSPYTIPSLVDRRPDTAQRNSESEAPTGHGSMRSVGDIHNPAVSHTNIDQGDSDGNTIRQSSLPIPSRIAKPETLGKLAVAPSQQAAPNLSADIAHDLEETEISNAAQGSASLDTCAGNSNDKSSVQAYTPDGELLDLKGVLSSPAPADNESVVGSDESGVTVHGYDAFGGFRVRHLGNDNGYMDRPVLRIADSASRILLGDSTADNSLEAPYISPGIRHKSSAPNLHRAPEVKDEVRRSSAIFTRPLSLARSLTERPTATFKKSENDESCHNLLAHDDAAAKNAPAALPGTDVVFGTKPILEPETTMTDMESPGRESSEYRRSPASAKGDWPGKDFADLNLCPESPTRRLRRGMPCAQTDGVAFKRPSSPASIPSRPSTIVVRAPPSREIAPFLFQDPMEERVKQDKLLGVATGNSVNTAGGIAHEAAPDTTFPPRTSSRKPKPPPIVVSPPAQLSSVNFFPQQASKAYGVQPETIQKPKNVKTFSQSVSPKTDSSKTQKGRGKPSHSPSSSSRKVISNIKGLFHKRSTESTSQTNGAKSRGSVRRKPGPDNKVTTNPLLTHQGTELSEPGRLFHYPNRGTRNAIRNPFVSPTTPFTATVQPDPYPEVKSSPVPPAQSPSTPVIPSLSNATTLTHALLDLAHVETDTQRKAHLIQLSKCMVEVVSAARDAEKAVERAKMEASRAEVGLLKVQKEVATMEGLVNTVIMQHGGK